MVSVDADTETAAAATARRPLVVLGVTAVVTIVADQLTKWWAIERLADPTRIIDLFWTLRFRLIYNRGTAFSLTGDSGPIVSCIAVVVVIILIRAARRQQHRWILLSYGLIVGGTVGNVVDRAFREGPGLLRGGVVDFVDPQWFPVFNLADAALTVGIAILLIVGFFTDAFDEETESADA